MIAAVVFLRDSNVDKDRLMATPDNARVFATEVVSSGSSVFCGPASSFASFCRDLSKLAMSAGLRSMAVLFVLQCNFMIF